MQATKRPKRSSSTSDQRRQPLQQPQHSMAAPLAFAAANAEVLVRADVDARAAALAEQLQAKEALVRVRLDSLAGSSRIRSKSAPPSSPTQQETATRNQNIIKSVASSEAFADVQAPSRPEARSAMAGKPSPSSQRNLPQGSLQLSGAAKQTAEEVRGARSTRAPPGGVAAEIKPSLSWNSAGPQGLRTQAARNEGGKAGVSAPDPKPRSSPEQAPSRRFNLPHWVTGNTTRQAVTQLQGPATTGDPPPLQSSQSSLSRESASSASDLGSRRTVEEGPEPMDASATSSGNASSAANTQDGDEQGYTQHDEELASAGEILGQRGGVSPMLLLLGLSSAAISSISPLLLVSTLGTCRPSFGSQYNWRGQMPFTVQRSKCQAAVPAVALQCAICC